MLSLDASMTFVSRVPNFAEGIAPITFKVKNFKDALTKLRSKANNQFGFIKSDTQVNGLPKETHEKDMRVISVFSHNWFYGWISGPEKDIDQFMLDYQEECRNSSPKLEDKYLVDKNHDVKIIYAKYPKPKSYEVVATLTTLSKDLKTGVGKTKDGKMVEIEFESTFLKLL